MLFKHLKTINAHRREVRKLCFKMGIPLRGLTHDLSKYSLRELSIHKYYDGERSPHDVAREKIGYSPSWRFHRAKNKHHWEYWVDSLEGMNTIKIPYKYVIEMFCDFVGAGKIYMRENWNTTAPLKYHMRTKKKRVFHEESLNLLEFLFNQLDKIGSVSDEGTFLAWYKRNRRDLKKKYKNGLFKNEK